MSRRFLRSQSGATAIEYALIALLVSVAIVSGATTIGTKLNGSFMSVATGLR